MNDQIPNSISRIDEELLKTILNDRKVLIVITRQSFFWFFYVYFSRYIEYPMAPFHQEMFRIGQKETIKRAGVMTFRDSGKSTILNTAYALWAIMGIPQKKHVLVVSQTQARAKDHLMNIRKEIETNELLSKNLGPFRETEDRWHSTILIIPRYQARITAISAEEGVRGLKEGPHRPDLIIADDIEDSNSVKTREGRDKTFNWFTGELLPLGEIDTKVIVLGNFLHEDSVLSRLEKMIGEEKMKGKFLRISLIDGNNSIAWPGKFLSLEVVEEFRQSIGNELTWQRDFLLRTIPTDYQVIHPDWIQFYDKIPARRDCFHGIIMGIDLAISLKNTADYTAIVGALIFGREENFRVFILPNPTNRRMSFPETISQIKEIYNANKKICPSVKILIEDVGYQRSAVEQLCNDNYCAEGIKVSSDKMSRLTAISNLIKMGKIVFPRQGAETLIRQLTGFGTERYDDLADAFSIVGHKAIEEDKPGPKLSIF